jgi:hypothetical protein
MLQLQSYEVQHPSRPPARATRPSHRKTLEGWIYQLAGTPITLHVTERHHAGSAACTSRRSVFCDIPLMLKHENTSAGCYVFR